LQEDNEPENIAMNMKCLVVIFVCFCVSIPLAAEDSSRTVGPLVWSSYANVLGNFIPRPQAPLFSPVVSNFTLDRGITVTRVELHAAIGAFNPFVPAPCTVLPAVKLTDGTHSVSLHIPTAPTDSLGDLGAVSADTGPIRLEFPADARLAVVIVPGDFEPPTFCTATEVNVTVQYHVRSGS
jgi:hypothetical protein